MLLFMAIMTASHAYKTKRIHNDKGWNCSPSNCDIMESHGLLHKLCRNLAPPPSTLKGSTKPLLSIHKTTQYHNTKAYNPRPYITMLCSMTLEHCPKALRNWHTLKTCHGLEQRCPNFFAYGHLLALKNNHGTSYPCSHKQSIQMTSIKN
jgi:hypothetical protein